MIYAVGQGNKTEISAIEKEIRERTAFSTDEQLKFVSLYTRKDFEDFLEDNIPADIICTDVTIFQGIEQAEKLRKRYSKAALILISDMSISPICYMKPTILAAGLLLKPLQEIMLKKTIEDIFACYIQTKGDEEIFVVETREEKYRIPYSEIMFFEARSKKIYACTKDYEYGFYDTMDHLEEKYAERFIRCHRSFMVNRKMVDQVKLSQNYLTLYGGAEIPLSRSYKSQIKELY